MTRLSTLSTLLRGHVPAQLVVQTTNRCNATCPQCGMRVQADVKRSAIAPHDMESLIDHAAAQGFQAISFTGGEPFLNTQNLLTMIRRARDAGIPYIRTGTNGFLFRNHERPDFSDSIKALADDLAGSGLRNFWISIDSHDPRIHESMRGLSGVIRGIEKALPIFHERGLFPSANLGINRNVGGVSTHGLNADLFPNRTAYLSVFHITYTNAFDRFFRFVTDLGFTMVNACYPMSIPEERTPDGLTPVYSASADEHIVRFARDEKHLLFTALGQVIPNHRRRIRIFSPLSSLRALVRQYDDNPDTNAHLPYRCRGGLDFFYVRSEDAMTFPCGFRGEENLGRFVRFNLNRHREKTGNRAWCLECDWECFRDPSNLFGPLTDLARPIDLLNPLRKDPGFFPVWFSDLLYYRACDFFDGREAPDMKRMSRFSRA